MYQQQVPPTPSARTQLGNSSYAIPLKKTDPANDYSYQSRLDILKGRTPALMEVVSPAKPGFFEKDATDGNR